MLSALCAPVPHLFTPPLLGNLFEKNFISNLSGLSFEFHLQKAIQTQIYLSLDLKALLVAYLLLDQTAEKNTKKTKNLLRAPLQEEGELY